MAKEELTMNAKLINPATFPNSLNAIFENVDNGSTHQGGFLPGAAKWKLTRDPLPVGRYRVKVEFDKPETKISPVQGLFEVSDT